MIYARIFYKLITSVVEISDISDISFQLHKMASIKRIFPPEILLEIFMLVVQTSPQYELLAYATVCSSWYYCAMEIIGPALGKVYIVIPATLQTFNITCSYMRDAGLNILHQAPVIHFDTGESATMYENVTQIWHPNYWPVIHLHVL